MTSTNCSINTPWSTHLWQSARWLHFLFGGNVVPRIFETIRGLIYHSARHEANMSSVPPAQRANNEGSRIITTDASSPTRNDKTMQGNTGVNEPQPDGSTDTTLQDPQPGPWGSSVTSGNPQETPEQPAKKRKKSSTEPAVSRDEFSALQSQVASMAEAMKTMKEGRPAKKPKTDQTVTTSDESVSTEKVSDDLVKPSNDEDSAEVQTAIKQIFLTDDAGKNINEMLAILINRKLRCKLSDERLAEKLESFKRPANVEKLGPTRVNPEIWASLPLKTRSQDIKFQKVEQVLLKSVVPIIACIESLMMNAQHDSKTQILTLLDAVALIGHSTYELNLCRREMIKPDLNQQFSSLCSTQVPVTGLLFGDSLSQNGKDIQETNKLGEKLGSRYENPAGSKQDHGKRGRGDKSPFRSGQYRQRLNSSRSFRSCRRKKSAENRQPVAIEESQAV